MSTLAGIASAQDLSLSVYPSEDELLEGFLAGELSYSQWRQLHQIIYDGIDSATAHWWDDVPNQAYFFRPREHPTTALDDYQKTPYSKKIGSGARGWRGQVGYRFGFRAIDEADSRYRLDIALRPATGWLLDMQVDRRFGDRERLARRGISYLSGRGVVREVRLGNYSTRLGLGLVWGYRGYLLENQYGWESSGWLFPDYGGQNGMLVRLRLGLWRLCSVVSVQRNETHRLASSAVQLERSIGGIRLQAIVGHSHLQARGTGLSDRHTKLAVGLRQAYTGGYWSAEGCWQLGDASGPAAMVVEGRQRLAAVSAEYAIWIYRDDFVDLASGAKSGSLYRQVTQSATQFTYRSRRQAQEGGLLRTVALLDRRVKMINSLIWSGIDRRHYLTRVLSGIEFQSTQTLTWRLDYLQSLRRPDPQGDSLFLGRHQLRLQSQIRTGELDVRTYVGYHKDDTHHDQGSWLLSVKSHSSRFGDASLWIKLSQYHLITRQLGRGYAFVRLAQEPWQKWRLAVKIICTYQRSASLKYATQFSVEVATQW